MCLHASFVEIGKREVWGCHRVTVERADVAYHVLATDFLPVAANSLLSLYPLACVLAHGLVSPLGQIAYSIGAAPTALRSMSQARHVGKIVVNVQATQGDRNGELFVISGGLGSLGLMNQKPRDHSVTLGDGTVVSLVFEYNDGEFDSPRSHLLGIRARPPIGTGGPQDPPLVSFTSPPRSRR